MLFRSIFLIPLFPLIASIINGIWGRRFSRAVVNALACGSMGLSMLLALWFTTVLVLISGAGPFALRNTLYTWVASGAFTAQMSFVVDPLSAIMLLVVTVVGFIIHVYSIGYMSHDPGYWRFFCYLNLFAAAMLTLVLGDNLLVLFVGWEGVGLCSYLLIGFWYKDFSKATAGMKAFVVNRIGDFAFLSGLFLLFWGLGGAWHSDTGQYRQDNKTVYAHVARVDPGHSVEGDEQPEAAETERYNVRVGPTVSFHELRQQIAITDSAGAHPIADSLAKKRVWGMPLVFVVCSLFFVVAADFTDHQDAVGFGISVDRKSVV